MRFKFAALVTKNTVTNTKYTSWKSACNTVIESQFGNGTVNNNLENLKWFCRIYSRY